MSDILSMVGPLAAPLGARGDRGRGDVGGTADAFATALDAPADKGAGEATDGRRTPEGRTPGDDGSDDRSRLPFADRMARTLAALDARQQQGGADAIRLPEPRAEDRPTAKAPDPTGSTLMEEPEAEPTATSDMELTEQTSEALVQADTPGQPVIPPMPVVSRRDMTAPSTPQSSAGLGEADQASETSQIADQPSATRAADPTVSPARNGAAIAAAAQPVAHGATPTNEDDPRTTTRRAPGPAATAGAASSQPSAGRQPASATPAATPDAAPQPRAGLSPHPVGARFETQSVEAEPEKSALADEQAPAPRVQVLSSSGIVAPVATAAALPGPAQQLTSALVTALGAAETPAANAAAPVPEAAPARPAALHSLTIQLQPAELGRVLARLTISDGQLTVAVQVETTEAHQRISTDRDILSNALRSAGYEVDRITVQQVPSGQAVQNQTAQGDQNRNTGNGFQATGEGPGGRGDGGANQGGDDRRQGTFAPTSERVGPGNGGSLYI